MYVAHATDTCRITLEDTKALHDNIRKKKYQALVLDAPVLRWMAANAPECDLYTVGQAFETWNLAIAYPPDVPDALGQAISASLIRLQVTSCVNWLRSLINRP